jgi:WD40 repeat protein
MLCMTTVGSAVPVAAAETAPRIVFTRQLDGGGSTVFTVNPSGRDERQVAIPLVAEDFNRSVWSHDGHRLLMSNIPYTDPTTGSFVGFRPATSAPDGSAFHLLALPQLPEDMYCSAWTPDDHRIVCGDDTPGLFSMRVSDGGGMRRLTVNPFGDQDVAVGFSPDGRRLAFLRYKPATKPSQDEQVALFLANPDGTRLHRITPYGLLEADELASANWSPDGHSLISANSNGRLVIVSADGSGVRRIALAFGTPDYFAVMPAYSPDGRQIVFSAFRQAPADLFVANLDGTHVHQITDSPVNEYSADWANLRLH